MELLEKIRQFDLNYYRSFAARIPTVFGCIYYNEENPNSHDSNHAHILGHSDIGDALEFIELFYLGKGIKPRIYGQSADELAFLRPFLEEHGFCVSPEDNILMVLDPKNGIPALPDDPDVRRVTDIAEVAPLFLACDGGEWNIGVAKRSLKSPDYTLFAVFEGGQAVSVAALQVDPDIGIARVDNVMTHPEYRGRGFCHRVMAALTGFYTARYSYPLYLYTDNPIAIKIYRGAGFEEEKRFSPSELLTFSAWKEYHL